MDPIAGLLEDHSDRTSTVGFYFIRRVARLAPIACR